MDIFINGKPADITLDTENTLGDVLAGIEQWISPTGNRIQKISIDGTNVSEDPLSDVFGNNIADIKKLEIEVSSFRELAIEALGDLLNTCGIFAETSFEDRPQIAEAWKKSAASRFLSSNIPDIHQFAAAAFSGEGLSARDLGLLLEERCREITDPKREIGSSEALVTAIALRMEELPLDIQTGKDQRAAETIQLFSKIGEKLFRIFFLFKSDGLSVENFMIDERSARVFIDEFNAALKELSAAYENRDIVLAGDIAEYELAPRLLTFFSSLKNISILNIPVVSSP